MLFFFGFFCCAALATDNHKNLTLQGMASYWSGSSEVYIAALYSEKPARNAEHLLSSPQLKRMELRITARQWRERNADREWKSAISNNNDQSVNERFASDILAFSAMLKGPLLQGDRMIIDYSPQQSSVSLNGVHLLSFEQPEFFHVLLRTWLGPQLPYASFRQQIMGADNASLADLQKRFNSVAFSSERKQLISQWPGNNNNAADTNRFDGAESDVAKNLYRLEVTRSILRQVIYPSRALRAKEEGTSLVKIRVDHKGALLDHVIHQSSGADNLDAAALLAIERSRFSAFPVAIADKELEFLVPVRFVLP